MPIARAALTLTLTLGLLSAPLDAGAQPTKKTPRIGLLSAGTGFADESPLLEAFQRGLRDLGYFDRQNILIDRRNAEGRYARLPGLAAWLLRHHPDVIVATSTPAVEAVARATRTIPIVMVAGGDPVRSGLVASLGRPGGNITGVSISVPGLAGKQVELLKEVVPDLTRVAVLANPATPATASLLEDLEGMARAAGLQLRRAEARGPSELRGAFSVMAKERVTALVVLPDAMFFAERARIARLAAKGRLPAIYPFREFVDAGGLMSYGPNTADVFRRVAVYVDEILRGAKPGELPVEQPSKLDLLINLRSANALGLTISHPLRARADQLIQ